MLKTVIIIVLGLFIGGCVSMTVDTESARRAVAAGNAALMPSQEDLPANMYGPRMRRIFVTGVDDFSADLHSLVKTHELAPGKRRIKLTVLISEGRFGGSDQSLGEASFDLNAVAGVQYVAKGIFDLHVSKVWLADAVTGEKKTEETDVPMKLTKTRVQLMVY